MISPYLSASFVIAPVHQALLLFDGMTHHMTDDLTRLTKLPSGLTVVSQHMPHAATAALGVWVSSGSRHELEDEHGLAHGLEHMAFKGTVRRTARAMAEEIEAVGGEINAATSVEYTCYTARVLGEDVPLALDILSDILTEPVFAPDELEREKNVILQEIAAVEDAPDDQVYDLFMATAYPKQPMGRPILGTEEFVSAFTPDAMRNYLKRHYTADRMVVAAAGAVDHDDLVRQVEDRFAPFAGRISADATLAAQYVGGDCRLVRDHEQAHIVLGFPGTSSAAGSHYPLQVFSALLGGGLSSRLFQEVREQRGLAYAIDSFHWPFADTGLFGIGASASPADVPEMMKVMLDCLWSAASTANEAEMGRARAQLKVGLLAALETPGGVLEHLARQALIYGHVQSRDTIAARLDAVTLADVRASGAALLVTAPTLVAIGPKLKLPSLAKIQLARTHAAALDNAV
jgi:predicted Zn-dependent peptidase